MIFTGFVLGLIVALVCSDLIYNVHRKDNFRHFQRLASQGFFKDIVHKDCCAYLAKKLEIEADGGDSPAEFVEWAIKECWIDADNRKVSFSRPARVR